LEQGSSALAKDLTLGLKHSRVDLPVLVDDVDGGSRGVGEVDDLLGAHVPSHLDALGLELGGVDAVPLDFMLNSVVSFLHPSL
jgi:hypothetical protein